MWHDIQIITRIAFQAFIEDTGYGRRPEPAPRPPFVVIEAIQKMQDKTTTETTSGLGLSDEATDAIHE